MNTRTGTLGLILLATLVAGCATGPSGQPIPRETVMGIERGVTTAPQVRSALGDPTGRTVADDGSETWTYDRLYRKDRPFLGLCWVPLFGWAHCLPTLGRDELRVAFDPEGVVATLEFASRETPLSRGARPVVQRLPRPEPFPGPFPRPIPVSRDAQGL